MNYQVSIDDRAYLGRAQNVKAVLDDDDYKLIYQQVEPFNEEVILFLNELISLEQNIQKYENSTKGDTIVKDEEKLDLAEYTSSKCKIFMGFAKINNHEEIIPGIDYSKTDINRIPQNILPGIIRNIINKMKFYIDDLEPYRITADTVQTIEDKLATYIASKQKVRLNQSVKQQQFKSMRESIDIINTKVDLLENLNEIFKETDEDFYKVLQNSIKIIDGTFGVISVRGYINNKEDNVPLHKVKVKITADKFKEQTTETTELGYFQFKNIPYGSYTLTFSCVGYKTDSMVINVLDKKHTEVEILFEKATI